MDMNPLTPAEKRVIIDKGTTLLLRVSMSIIKLMACMFAGSAIDRYIIPKINLKAVAGGRVSMMR